MGGALIRGLIARGLPAQNISVGEAHQARRIALADELGVHVTADNREAVARRRRRRAGGETAGYGGHRAGSRRRLRATRAAGAVDRRGHPRRGHRRLVRRRASPVVRAMPNRPALNSAGATRDVRARRLERAHRELAAEVLGAVGTTVWVPDEDAARRRHGAVRQRPRLLLPARRAHDRRGGESRPERATARRSSRSRRCSARAAWRATATAISRACAPKSPRRAAPPRPRCARSTPRTCVVSSPPRCSAATDRGREMARGLRRASPRK